MSVTDRRTARHLLMAYYALYRPIRIDRKEKYITRSQAVARIADRTAKNCRGHVT